MIRTIVDLVAFLKHYHRDWLDDPSLDSAMIPADLPDGLAAIYRELGGLVELNFTREGERQWPFASQDCLVALSQLKRVDGMIEFSWENQGNWSARCAAGSGDPPVYSDAQDVWDERQRGFIVVCESLNNFLTTLCLQEAVFASRNLISLRSNVPVDQVLTIPVQPLWLDGCYVYETPSHQFFASADREILIMDGAGAWIGSPTRAVADLVRPGINFMAMD